MKSHISLMSVLAAIMLFVIAVAMHEAARADSLASQGVAEEWRARNDSNVRPPDS